MTKTKIKSLVVIGTVTVIAIIVLIASFKIVPAGSTGVVTTFGKVSPTVMQEGMHFRKPFIQSVHIISNKIQNGEVEANAVSKDLQAVNSKVAINFRVGLDSSATIFKNIGKDYSSIILKPAILESVKSVGAKYTAEELITQRAQVSDDIKAALENKVKEYGIIIEKFNIINFDFSAEFNAAIEAKQVAEQNLIKTKTEQEQAIAVAKADAEKRIIGAEAEANSTLTKAKAQADANQMLNNSLSSNVIEYEKIQKWDGKLPQATGGSPILDFRTTPVTPTTP